MSKEVQISQVIFEPLEKVTKLLAKEKTPYAVMGGLALQAWGAQRTTRDIDLNISLDEITPGDFLSALGKIGLKIIHKDKVMGHFELIETEYESSKIGISIGVDFFIAKTTYQKQALERAVMVHILGHPVKLISPEDLILNKLLSARPLDLSDVKSVVIEQRDLLDQSYLRVWARNLGVSRRLEALLQ